MLLQRYVTIIRTKEGSETILPACEVCHICIYVCINIGSRYINTMKSADGFAQLLLVVFVIAVFV